ncbi:MAG: GNAT family N-acetyltransferase [Candidatus Aenigmarchaeota archaeon]|nr:GNAT family N-acetyltransferase [Candidatus Aenigmarchaeota archaeon]
MKIKIRYGKMSDLKAFARIATEAFPKHDILEECKYFKIHAKKKEVFVAEADKKAVGFVIFSMEFWGSDTLFIHSFAVDKDYRKKGTGTVLLDKVIEMAKKKSARRIFLDTWVGNKKAIKFYKKRGFEICGYANNLYREGLRCPILSLKVKK